MRGRAVAVFSLFVMLLACDDGVPMVAPRNLAPLGGDLRSGMTLEEVQRLDSLRGCTWDVREVERYGPTGDAPAQRIVERIRVDAASESCRHLGVSGSLRLQFVNDRLLSIEFIPGDLGNYLRAIEQQVGEPVEVDKQYHVGSDVVLEIVDRSGRKVALWQDADLAVWMLSGS